jgi:outer membrane protein TolC
MPLTERVAATYARDVKRISPQETRRCCFVFILALQAFLMLIPSITAQEAPPASTVDQRPLIALTLPRAVEIAMQHNRHLALAQLATAESREKRTIAQSHFYPQISNQSAALYLTDLEGIVIPAGAFGNFASTGLVPGQTIRLSQGAQTAYTSGTGLVQPLTQYFKIRAGERAAEADVRTAEIDEKDAENSISLLVHKLYFDILTAQAHLSADEESVKAATTNEQESARDVAEGRALDVALLESHADLLDQEESALTVQLSIDDLTLQLDDALGLPLGTRLALDPDALGDPPKVPSRSDAIATIKEHNPKVLAARQSVEKAKAGVSAARDAYIPDVSGSARYSYQSGVPFLVHNFGTFGGRVSYDLFDGGAREAELKEAKIQLAMAETQLQQTESDVSIEVASVYDKVEQLQKLVAVASEALKTRVEAARISNQRLEQNAELPSTVAKNHAAAYAAKASMLDAQFGLFLAEHNIQQLLGQRP